MTAVGIEQNRSMAPPPTANEKDTYTSLSGDEGLAAPTTDEMVRRTLAALYGDEFPLLKDNPKIEDWANWGRTLWDKHGTANQERLHLVRRNRLFRKGVQWISAIGYGLWREPPRPREAARIVSNLIAPALDQRIQLIGEQRPGFQVRAENNDPAKMKRAEAQQRALEYQWDQQSMAATVRELAFWAGTDGVAFGEVYWDAERGPWDERMGEMPGQKGPMGDPCTKVRRIEQVRVSAGATATRKPWYWIIKETMPHALAVREYGQDAVEDVNNEVDTDLYSSRMSVQKLGFLLPEDDYLLREQKTVDRITVYCEKSAYLPQGLTLVVIGRKVVMLGPLVCGMVPMFSFYDGSTDPAFYKTPLMELWIESQMRINAVLSKWVENVRLNAGPRLLGKEHAIVNETLVGGTMSLIGVRGLGNVADLVRPIEGFSLAQDAKELLAREIKAFEDVSGYNDVSRGQFTADQSGRAILAIREQLERVFTPPITAASEAMTEWAKINLAWMAWGYDVPRDIGIEGKSRPDLVAALSATDFDGIMDVTIDPETLMPMPRSLKLFLLDAMYSKGAMSIQEYRRRTPYAYTRDLQTPDEDHEARARRVCEAIRQTGNPMALPILWQDNEAIHQDILERELILPDDTDPTVREAASQRWMALANQAQMKMGVMPPGGPGPGGGGPSPQGGGNSAVPGMSATEQPFQGTNPGVAASTMSHLGQPDAVRMGADFDHRQPIQ